MKCHSKSFQVDFGENLLTVRRIPTPHTTHRTEAMILPFASLVFIAAAFPLSVSAVASSGTTTTLSAQQLLDDSTLFLTNIGFLGSTATAGAPFLAATDPAHITYGIPTSSYTAPQPIETAIQAKGHKEGDRNTFELLGNLSPYYVNKNSWGVYEYALPEQCSIKQVHLLSRHGSRYPDSSIAFAKTFETGSQFDNFSASGELSFLNNWKYDQGVNLLTKLGNQQLFDKGVRSFFRYGQLFDWNNPEKIVARATTQDRITKTAEYFLAGFFGLDWQDYVNLELIIDQYGFNNTLASFENCPVAYKILAVNPAATASSKFLVKYLTNAVERLNKQITGIELSYKDVLSMQQLCAYETNNLGFSHFCNLFTQQEWEDFEYYLSWNWYNDYMFGSPIGRAMGIGWVEEFKHRLTGAPANQFNYSEVALQNTTLDTNETYFPSNQTFYFDFTHDATISSIFTALGMKQFVSEFSTDGKLGDKKTPFDVSAVVPFASQTFFEVIECDEEIPASRATAGHDHHNDGPHPPPPPHGQHGNGGQHDGHHKREDKQTFKYIHMTLNDHTIPLHENFPEYCEARDDGWCDFDKFVEHLSTLWDKADFANSCFEVNYDYTKIVTDGHPSS